MGDRSFLDAQDRRWLAKKRDKTIMWIFLIVLAGLAIAYWPLVVVAVAVGGVWLVGRRMRRGVWYWNEATQPAPPTVTPSVVVAKPLSPAKKRVQLAVGLFFGAVMIMIPVSFVGLCLFWFIAAHTR